MSEATINVNLKPCRSNCARFAESGSGYGLRHGEHFAGCPGIPVPIPCPVPRSVEFTVRLGECIDAGRIPGSQVPRACAPDGHHHDDCPARPIRVTCTILGETWEDSQVAVCELGINELQTYSGNDDALYAACRARWALVKALMLGQPIPTMREAMLTLVHQRDVVFSALCEMVPHHVARNAAANRAGKAAGLDGLWYSEVVDQDSEPAFLLKEYVARMVRQIEEPS